MTASQLTLSAPQSFSASPVPFRSNKNDPAAGLSNFSKQLRDQLAGHEAAEPVHTHPERTAAEAGKPMPDKPTTGKPAAVKQETSGNKERKISQQNPVESGNETDTAQLSSGAQQLASNLSSSDGQGGGQPEKPEQPVTAKVQGNSRVGPSNTADTGGAGGGDLALAMRISSGESEDANSGGQPSTTEAAGAAIAPTALSSRAQLTPPPEAAQQRHQPEAPPPIETAAVAKDAGLPNSAKSAASEEIGKAPAAGFEAELNKVLAEPVRAAHVQIAGSENQRIDIRMLERGGALSVTVRSADSGLTKALQEHAPELAGRLSQENFRTELWAPSQAKSQGGHDSSGGNPQSRGGENSGQRNPGQQQKQNGKQSQTPEWIENFENNQTVFQKRIDYTWHP